MNSETKVTERLLFGFSRSLLDLASPILRRMPRGSGTVYRLLGGYRPLSGWRDAGKRSVIGTDHGFRMRLDLSDAIERETYYLGRFFEWELEAALSEFLSTGDTFIDVGANIGMVTLSAVRRVGPEGQVLSYEPNPHVRERLIAHIADNRLGNVKVFDVALGKEAGTATLTTATARTGTGTLRMQGNAFASHPVKVSRLDSFVEHVPLGKRTFLKIDTEGYDFNVLQGADAILEREKVVVFAEVNPKWMAELGQEVKQLLEFMAGFGFEAFFPETRAGITKRVLTLVPYREPAPHHWFNLLFLRRSELSEAQQKCFIRMSGGLEVA